MSVMVVIPLQTKTATNEDVSEMLHKKKKLSLIRKIMRSLHLIILLAKIVLKIKCLKGLENPL
jgi:hypothetical protein